MFRKTMENVWKHKLVTTKKRRKYLVSEPNFDTTTYFTESLLVIEMENPQIIINRPVYFGLSILELIYAFW